MRAAAAVLVFLLAACERVPVPRFPQVEQAAEVTREGGDRYRAHRACANATTSVDGLLACMEEAGWEFVARGPDYPEAECWEARDRGDLDRILPLCFVRRAEPATPP